MNKFFFRQYLPGRSWSILFLITITFLFLLSVLLLILIDTYSILHPYNTRFYDEPNRNFLKVEHILAHPKKYNGFIFGSSRVGAILPQNLKHRRFYNMTHSEGIPHEHLLNLRLFLKHNVPIKEVLLGLDEFSYQVSFEQHQNRFLTRAHPLASNSSWINFYRFYFFRFPTKHDKSQFKKRFLESINPIPIDIANQDYFYRTFSAYLPKTNPNDPKYLIPTRYSGNKLESTLRDIREIIAVCRQHDIKLIIFLNPIHHTTYASTNKALLYQFKQSLQSISPYFDFSGPNPITLNNLNFLDTSHYTLNIGNIMIKEIKKGASSPFYRPLLKTPRSLKNK